VWTADSDAVVEKIRRGYHAFAAVGEERGWLKHGCANGPA
jgi:hypothetical protein